MALQLPPPPTNPVSNSFEWREWFYKLYTKTTSSSGISFTSLDFAGSNINSIVTRDHNTLTNIQGGDPLNRYHLTASEHEAASKLSWNVNQGTVNVAMGFDGVSLQLGQEEYFPPVLNNTGSTIPNATVVGFSGVSGTDPTIAPFLANGATPTSHMMGVTTMDFANGARGIVTKFGYLHDVNTTGSTVSETWSVGDILYASHLTAGALTKVKPTVPNLAIPIAAVITVNATTGILLVRVIPQPQLYYGTFHDTTNQVPAAVNTPQGITFNTTDTSQGVSLGSPTSRVVCTNSGQYNFQFSAQIRSSTSSAVSLFIWPRINGVDVADSATEVTIKSNSDVIVPAWNFQLSMNAGDYFEMIWAATSTSVSIASTAAQTTPYVRPAIPGIILTVNQINQ